MSDDTTRRQAENERSSEGSPDPPGHQFAVGTFDCRVVQDGTFAYTHPAETFFANAPERERRQALVNHGIDPVSWEEYVSPYPSLLVETGDRTVLIDTGAGDLVPTTGKLRSNLQEVGVAPTDIDTVVLTHGHPDHIGGCVDDAGSPAFPNARYVMADEEWEFWTSDPELSSLPVGDDIKAILRDVPRQTLPPVEDQLELVDADSETEIRPGIRVRPAPGHTPGHMAVSITSEDDHLLHIVDTVLHPVHLSYPEWHAAIDYAPDEVLATRTRFLEEAATKQTLVCASHFPAPGVGHVTQTDGSWEWHPIDH